ncbi:MAG: hypothetical protein K6G87_03240 [Butyrivibrio sp.]|uniref:hypothetical protein n=1 Tax=Butyrivibrio sp. TaxID=28121 RepID=UPI0025E791AE|nr:hypothetical protein [Butyrivibrio sp.]MCR5770234.1 hypothetical protein [Butyrivibrio sp.]
MKEELLQVGDFQSIKELNTYFINNNISSYDTGFYVDSDHIGPCLYGIYKDYWEDDYIVYENLNDGSRRIDYKGKDEALAVSIFYDRFVKYTSGIECSDDHKVNGYDNVLSSYGKNSQIYSYNNQSQVAHIFEEDHSGERTGNTLKAENGSLVQENSREKAEDKAQDPDADILKKKVKYKEFKKVDDWKVFFYVLPILIMIIRAIISYFNEDTPVDVSSYGTSLTSIYYEEILSDMDPDDISIPSSQDVSIDFVIEKDEEGNLQLIPKEND